MFLDTQKKAVHGLSLVSAATDKGKKAKGEEITEFYHENLHT